jgi:hypothetical protein
MQNLVTLAFLLFGCACSNAALEPGSAGYHVLFIGNSLTYFNDLPGTVAQLAAMGDDTIYAESVAQPGFAVIDHATGKSNAVDMIRRGGWDYVVLQQGPTTSQLGRDTLILAARQLEPDIRAAGARSALLMVWPPSGNPEAFDQVRASYQQAADAVGGLFLPAGEAWRAAWTANADLPLYGPDGFHPSELGTYLTALVVYEGLTGHDAGSLPDRGFAGGHPLSTDAPTVRLLQRVAHETVTRLTNR